MLDAAGPSAGAIAQVWWWMFGVAAAVLLAVSVIWLLAMSRRAAYFGDQSRRISRRWIVGGGMVLPVVSISALLVFGSSAGMHQLPLPGLLTRNAENARDPLRIDAIGHQWWWELRYSEGDVRLRNELRIPVGRPVDIHTSSVDVIHSFWVPRLGGKLDAIPGRTQVVRLQADQAGVYRGQCAEFCGTGHAHMVMTVQAMEAAEFEQWLRAASKSNTSGGPASAEKGR